MSPVLRGPALTLALILAAAPAAAEEIIVDAAAPTRPFPHFWEHLFGSGRAVLSLRESYRDDLRTIGSVCHARSRCI